MKTSVLRSAPADHRFGTWPFYSAACRRDVDELLRKGGSLSAYCANQAFGVRPAEDSWAYRLEEEIKKKFMVKHAIAVNSGTAALHAALFAMGLRGREVITSPYTFSATVAAIIHAGGKPVFADVNPDIYSITRETVEPLVTKRTAAILPVHLFGYFQDLSGLASLGVPLIEDACQAVGAMRNGRYSGTVGLAGAYSFNGTKNLPAGEGGALVTNSDRIAEKARLFMNHAENFHALWVGLNYRMNELTACVAYHGLLALEERNRKRQELAGVLGQVRFFHPSWYRKIPHLHEERSHVFYVYPFRIKGKGNRKRFVARMNQRDITVGQGYIRPPLHHYPAFRKYTRQSLPVVDKLSSKTLCFLDCVRPPATVKDMEYVARSIQESLNES